MTNAERFQESKRIWSATLAPATAIERRLVTFIVCQDWLLYRSILRAIGEADQRRAVQYESYQLDLADSIECMIRVVTALQKSRLGVPPDPPPPVAAKVIEMPRRRPSAPSHFGRPRVIAIDRDALPSIKPFGPIRLVESEHRERGSRPVLQVELAA